MTNDVPAGEGRAHLHLTATDFDACAWGKHAAEALRRARLVLRKRMLGWAARVLGRLEELGLALEITHAGELGPGEGSAELVRLARDAAGREAIARLGAPAAQPAAADTVGAWLWLRIDSEAVEVGVAMPPPPALDARNLVGRLDDARGANQLERLLETLPEQFVTCVDGVAAQRTDLEVVRAAVARGARLEITWRIARDVAVTHSALLDEQLADAMVALGSVYRLVAWAEANDYVGLEADRERSERPREERSAGRRERKRRPEEAPEVSPPGRPHLGADRRPLLRATLNAGLRRAGGGRGRGGAPALVRGAQVRIAAGPFAGKVGVVKELDGKGSARVMLGLLAAHLPVEDLVVSDEREDRPALRSSHRKLPVGG